MQVEQRPDDREESQEPSAQADSPQQEEAAALTADQYDDALFSLLTVLSEEFATLTGVIRADGLSAIKELREILGPLAAAADATLAEIEVIRPPAERAASHTRTVPSLTEMRDMLWAAQTAAQAGDLPALSETFADFARTLDDLEGAVPATLAGVVAGFLRPPKMGRAWEAELREERLEHAGVTRRYLVALPSAETVRPMPILMVFHGLGGTADQVCASIELVLDLLDAIVVCPDGTPVLGIGQTWPVRPPDFDPTNALGHLFDAISFKTDDLGLVEAILDRLDGEFGVDRERVYGLGFSNGAVLLHQFAIQAGPFVSFIAFAGSLFEDQEIPAATPWVSVLQIHGDVDTVVPYGGGPGPIIGLPFDSAGDTVERWAMHNRCAPDPDEIETVAEITIVSYRDCTDGSFVQLWTMHGVGHVPSFDGLIEVLEQALELVAEPDAA